MTKRRDAPARAGRVASGVCVLGEIKEWTTFVDTLGGPPG
jgi:hypothetical protein